jgi:Protein of unknown function (DUF2934)
MPKSKSASTTTKETPKKSPKVAVQPRYDEIALRAYHIYLGRGATAGDPMQDWLQAERELAQAPKKTVSRKTKIVSIAA